MLTDDHHDREHAAAKRHGTRGPGAKPAGEHGGAGDRGGVVGHGPAKKELEHRVRELEAEVAGLGRELEDAKDKYLRALADFDNYRKRVARENEERTRCANEDLIKQLLEVIDNLERAIDASGAADVDSLRKGLELTYAQMKDLLAREGLCPIKCLGEKFDPNYHEAVMALEKEGAASESVVEEIQKGYTLGNKVIRPSKVVVSK